MKMLKQMMIVMGLLGSLISVNAALCSNVIIKNIYAESDRYDDAKTLSNKLVVEPVEQCGAKKYFYVGLDKPAYGAMLTMLLTSMSSGQGLDIAIDEEDNSTFQSSRMIYVRLKK
ncbi:MAG: hypothetical protein OCC49_13730 [Fibrobacterales bacterium]